MDKMIYFASIPRSGSTLLASLLGQREDTYVSPTSNLPDILGAVAWQHENNPATKASQITDQQLYSTMRSILESQYSDRSESVIIDKSRQWADPVIMATMEKVTGEPVKIIATVRPMAECIASFYLIDKSELPIKQWIKESELMKHLMVSYQILRDGYKKYPDQFCLVEYDDLIFNTQFQLDKIARFLNIPSIKFDPKIEQVEENDNAWGVKDLHKLNPVIEKADMDVRGILGDDLYRLYQGGEFWNDKPEPIRGDKPLDLALEAGLHGKFDKGYEILKSQPENDRVRFNLGLYEMMKGNLLRGHKLLDFGRNENIFGNTRIKSAMPIWKGESGATVLMEMEGGFGDMFHCIRYAKDIACHGNKVIISGYEVLSTIMNDVEGVAAFVSHQGAEFIYHDFWLPSMSAPVALNLEWSDVSGKPYLKRMGESEGKVGVKWSGNPKFEHQQHRLFNKQLMFDAVEGFDCISLQKGDDPNAMNDGPDWMETPALNNWDDTRKQLSRCEIVVTSCTGLAHLSGAMGIKTFVVVPILPYYIWAYAGDKSPHYDSVTLFRQEEYGNWKAPFWKLTKAIREELWKADGETTLQFIEA
jgi:hypothetical protein